MRQDTSGTITTLGAPRSRTGMPHGERGCGTLGNSVALRQDGLPVQANGFSGLSPQQQEAHRAKIGVRAQAILDQFWRDNETPDAVRAVEIEGWMDVLENCSHGEIRMAWATYQKEGPRSQAGRLSKPDAGALYRIIHRHRPTPKPVQVPEPVRDAPRVTKEQAAKILEEAGFRPKQFGHHGRQAGVEKNGQY